MNILGGDKSLAPTPLLPPVDSTICGIERVIVDSAHLTDYKYLTCQVEADKQMTWT